jgi:hypothetical protein
MTEREAIIAELARIVRHCVKIGYAEGARIYARMLGRTVLSPRITLASHEANREF